MVLSGRRSLSRPIFLKLAPALRLSQAETKYLEKLVELGSQDSLQDKVQALNGMSRSLTYKKRHPNEVEFFEYMSRWYHVLIREMSRVEDFRNDPKWIRARMRWKIPESQIRTALDFLIEHGYLEVGPKGQVVPDKESLSCEDEVFSTTLKNYHRQMLNLAVESMENTPAPQRELHGYTFAIDAAQYESAKKIVEKALSDIAELEKQGSKPKDSVYHMQIALFPMTQGKGEDET